MIFILVFLAGVAAGAGLAWHFAGVAELKRKAAEYDRVKGPR